MLSIPFGFTARMLGHIALNSLRNGKSLLFYLETKISSFIWV